MKRVAVVVLVAAALVVPVARAFTPTDPLAAQQWYLEADHAFEAWPDLPTTGFQPVRVAVLDTGVDVRHPDLADRIVAAKSFVGGSTADVSGHGTFVAGVIAADIDNGIGIAGIAFPAQLLIAKIVHDSGLILPEQEARAIRWAVDNGARVINLSIGGLRDPLEPRRDTYSPVEQDAVEYAYSKGAVVVAAVGNGDQAPHAPWGYASYPAALPHVIGVGAIARSGAVPGFSNRDAVYTDIVAPGEGIVSTVPRGLTAARPACTPQGYSPCADEEYRDAEGTSFAAPQVAAAAAILLSIRPQLRPEQATALLERTADDVTPLTGCPQCATGRDSLSGWGSLDIAAAVHALEQGDLGAPHDSLEPNDDAGLRARTLWGRLVTVQATIDYWDDQIDVYRVKLFRGQHLALALDGPPQVAARLVLWKPGTTRVDGLTMQGLRRRAAQSVGGAAAQTIAFDAAQTGWYFVEVKATAPGAGAYTLRITKT